MKCRIIVQLITALTWGTANLHATVTPVWLWTRPYFLSGTRPVERNKIVANGYCFAGLADAAWNADGKPIPILTAEDIAEEVASAPCGCAPFSFAKDRGMTHDQFGGAEGRVAITKEGFSASTHITKNLFCAIDIPYYTVRIFIKNSAASPQETIVVESEEGFGNTFLGGGIMHTSYSVRPFKALSGTFTCGALLDTTAGANAYLTINAEDSVGILTNGSFDLELADHVKLGFGGTITSFSLGKITCGSNQTIKPGTYNDAHIYLALHHLNAGITGARLGYVFTRLAKAVVTPASFCYRLPNGQKDTRLDGWASHNISCDISCNLATKRYPHLPKITAAFAKTFAGKSVTNAWLLGGTVALEALAEF
jgi:hypothetical protein